MESGRTWNDNAGIAGGLVWMHGNSGDMDAGGWHDWNDYAADFSQPIEENRDYYAAWE